MSLRERATHPQRVLAHTDIPKPRLHVIKLEHKSSFDEKHDFRVWLMISAVRQD